MVWNERLHPRAPNGEFTDNLVGRLALDAGFSGALGGSRAYDSVPRRVEWDGELHGSGADQKMRDALADYYWHYDEITNAHLRGTSGPSPARMAGWGPPRIATTEERVAQLDRAMAPLPHSIVVYRGVDNPSEWLDRGRELGYLSASVDPATAGHFAEASSGGRVRILVPAGVGAVGVGPDELEVLLQRGLRYRGVVRPDGSVDAEIVP